MGLHRTPILPFARTSPIEAARALTEAPIVRLLQLAYTRRTCGPNGLMLAGGVGVCVCVYVQVAQRVLPDCGTGGGPPCDTILLSGRPDPGLQGSFGMATNYKVQSAAWQ